MLLVSAVKLNSLLVTSKLVGFALKHYFLTSSDLVTVNFREDERIAFEKNLTEYKD